MRLTIELTPDQEERLMAAAETEGMEMADFAQKIVIDHLPEEKEKTEEEEAGISAKNREAIALLQKWLEEDATDDPEVIRKANEEYEELKRNLNANRAATGERLVFP